MGEPSPSKVKGEFNVKGGKYPRPGFSHDVAYLLDNVLRVGDVLHFPRTSRRAIDSAISGYVRARNAYGCIKVSCCAGEKATVCKVKSGYEKPDQ